MNVTISEQPTLIDIEVAIVCPCIDDRVQRIVASLNALWHSSPTIAPDQAFP